MENTITEIKNLINGFNRRLDIVKKRIDGLEGIWVEFIQSENNQKGRRVKAIFENIMAENLTKFDKTTKNIQRYAQNVL